MTTTTLTEAEARAAEALAQAQARLAAMPEAMRQHVEATVEAMYERLPRTFVGPGTAKGRQPIITITPAEYAAFVASGAEYILR